VVRLRPDPLGQLTALSQTPIATFGERNGMKKGRIERRENRKRERERKGKEK